MPQNRHIPIFPSSLGAEALIRVMSEDVFWVDALTHTPPHAMQGSQKYPYDTIQKALDACGTPTSAAEELRGHVVNVLPGIYEESIAPPAAGIVHICGWGAVQLGTVAVPRSINWTTDQTLTVATLPFLILVGAGGAPAVRESFAVTGDVVLAEAVGGAGAVGLAMQNVHVAGDVDGTAKAGVTWLRLSQCNFAGNFTVPLGVGANVHDSNFQGTCTVDEWEKISGVLFANDVTVTTAPTGNNIRGLRECDFHGAHTWTGPAESFACDSYTWHMFAESGWALAGGATAVILDGGQMVRQIAAAGSQLTADAMGAATEIAHDGVVVPHEEIAVQSKLQIRALLYADSDNAADTWTARLRLGGVAGPPPTGNLLANTGAFDLVATAGVIIVAAVTVTAVGAGGTCDVHVRIYNEAGAVLFEDLLFDEPIDTTVDVLVVVTGECSTANAGNQVTLRELVVASSYATI